MLRPSRDSTTGISSTNSHFAGVGDLARARGGWRLETLWRGAASSTRRRGHQTLGGAKRGWETDIPFWASSRFLTVTRNRKVGDIIVRVVNVLVILGIAGRETGVDVLRNRNLLRETALFQAGFVGGFQGTVLVGVPQRKSVLSGRLGVLGRILMLLVFEGRRALSL